MHTEVNIYINGGDCFEPIVQKRWEKLFEMLYLKCYDVLGRDMDMWEVNGGGQEIRSNGNVDLEKYGGNNMRG